MYSNINEEDTQYQWDTWNIGAYGTYDGKQKAPSQVDTAVKEDSKLERAETVYWLGRRIQRGLKKGTRSTNQGCAAGWLAGTELRAKARDTRDSCKRVRQETAVWQQGGEGWLPLTVAAI